MKIVRQFHNGMMARVLDDGNASDPFQAFNGVKQGFFLALCCSAVLSDVRGNAGRCHQGDSPRGRHQVQVRQKAAQTRAPTGRD